MRWHRVAVNTPVPYPLATRKQTAARQPWLPAPALQVSPVQRPTKARSFGMFRCRPVGPHETVEFSHHRVDRSPRTSNRNFPHRSSFGQVRHDVSVPISPPASSAGSRENAPDLVPHVVQPQLNSWTHRGRGSSASPPGSYPPRPHRDQSDDAPDQPRSACARAQLSAGGRVGAPTDGSAPTPGAASARSATAVIPVRRAQFAQQNI